MRRLTSLGLILLGFACSSSKTTTPAPGPGGPSTPKSSWLVGDNGLMLSIGANGEAHARAHLTDASLFGLICVDQYTAWAVGAQGEILYTTDSGTHWVTQSSGTTASLYAVSFSNAQHGVAAGESGTLLETDDGGAHWQLIGIGTMAEPRSFRAVILSASSGAGVAVGDAGLVAWTNDGGRTWAPHDSAGAATLSGVDLNDDGVAVAVGQGGAAFRIDGDSVQPLTWTQTSVRDLSAVRFLPDDDHLFAVGAQGTILQGQLSSGTAQLAGNPSLDDLYAVAIFGDDTAHYGDLTGLSVMAAGANGAIVYAAASDAPFEVVASHTSAAIRSLDELSGD
jgi:photosystem II stability/assembly factor-like uncharacterized protein